jgi:hypothetical protein
MKAISLWQPWASLIACGAKRYETRSWHPPPALIGQFVAIHAARKIDRDAAALAQDIMYGQHPVGGFDLADRLEKTMAGTPDALMGIFGMSVMPVGCIVAVARLEGAFQLGAPAGDGTSWAMTTTRRLAGDLPFPALFAVASDPWGDFSPGRWAWRLGDIRALTPPPAAKGRQGFFDLPPGWLAGSYWRGA